MATEIHVWESPRKVVITEKRWHVFIDITDADGVEHKLVASADGSLTGHSSIYFATEAEFEEDY